MFKIPHSDAFIGTEKPVISAYLNRLRSNLQNIVIYSKWSSVPSISPMLPSSLSQYILCSPILKFLIHPSFGTSGPTLTFQIFYLILISDYYGWSSCFVAWPVGISTLRALSYHRPFQFLPWICKNNNENRCKKKDNCKTEPVIIGHWNVKIICTAECVGFSAIEFVFTFLNNLCTHFSCFESPYNFTFRSVLKFHYIGEYKNRQGYNNWKYPDINW